jgi:hypothetical protein
VLELEAQVVTLIRLVFLKTGYIGKKEKKIAFGCFPLGRMVYLAI